MNITRITTFQAKETMSNNVYEFLLSILPLIEQSPGCQSCRLLKKQDNPQEFLIIEDWESAAAHQSSVKNIPPEKITIVMPMLATPPSGVYYTI